MRKENAFVVPEVFLIFNFLLIINIIYKSTKENYIKIKVPRFFFFHVIIPFRKRRHRLGTDT